MSSSASSRILSNACLNSVNDAFAEKGLVLRIAGETVRDMILNADKIDPLKLITDATRAEMVSILRNCPSVTSFSELSQNIVPTFVARAQLKDKTIIFLGTLDTHRYSTVPLAATESLEKWKLTAYNRFFTINSLFMNFDGEIVDFYGGKEDIEKGVIRFIGNPPDVIKDHPMVTFLYLHFYFEYAKEKHLPGVIEAIRENLALLESISKKDLWPVVLRLLCQKNIDKLIPFMMVDLQIGKYLGFYSFRKKDLREFKAVYKNLSSIGPPSPTILLASLIRNELELDTINDRLSLPREFRFFIIYILKNRRSGKSLHDLQKEIELKPVLHRELYRIALVELLRYEGRMQDLLQFFWSNDSHDKQGFVDPFAFLLFFNVFGSDL